MYKVKRVNVNNISTHYSYIDKKQFAGIGRMRRGTLILKKEKKTHSELKNKYFNNKN